MRDFPWITSITALKDLGYSRDCRVPETDHLLVEMLQYKYHLAELFLKCFCNSHFTLPNCLNAPAPTRNMGSKDEEPQEFMLPPQ